MPFAPFHDLCEEVARAETRSLVIGPGAPTELPAGPYEFVEMYCDEKGCDCRRVLFMVISPHFRQPLAVIGWGWEARAFYEKWLHMDDPDLVTEMMGPALNLGSPQSKYAQELLDLAEDLLLCDPAYVDRIKRHYAMFRARVDSARTPQRVPVQRGGRKAAKGWWRKRR